MIIHDSQPNTEEADPILEAVGTVPPPMKKRHRVVIIAAWIVMIIAVVAVALFIFLANSSVKGTVHVGKAPASDSAPQTHKDLTLKGQYIRFKYSDTYISQDSQQTVPGAIEQHVLLSSGFEGRQMSVVVSRPIEPELGEYSPYKYRLVHPELYSEKPLKIVGSTGSIMVKLDGTEQTVFIVRGEMIATISVTATSAKANLDTDVQKVVSSFSWN